MARDPGDDGHKQNAHHDGALQAEQGGVWQGQAVRTHNANGLH